MPTSEFMCERCGKVFSRKSFLKNHKNRKIPCKFLELPSDDIATELLGDDLILNTEIDFPDLPKFDINILSEVEYYSVMISAVRRSGKTTLLKHIYPSLLNSYDIVFFVSYSLHNPVYDFVSGPKLNVDGQGFFKDLLLFQKKTKGLLNILVITDDHLSLKNKHDGGLLKTYVAGRNSWVGIMVSLQDPVFLHKTSRGNTDYVILGNSNAEMTQGIVEKFMMNAGVKIPKFIQTKSQKIDYLTKFVFHHTKNHNFIIIDNIDHDIYKFRVQL